MIQCPQCESPKRQIWNEGRHTASACERCGLIFSGEAMPLSFFEEDYFDTYVETSQADRVRIEDFRNKLDEMPVQLQPPLLDIGAGWGFFAQALPAAFQGQITLVEPSNFARQHLETIAEAYPSLDAIPSQRRFASITMWEVLVHIQEPIPMLQAIRERLTEDGILLIKVAHQPRHLFESAQRMAFTRRSRSFLHMPSTYLHFTPDSMRFLLEQAGFRVQQWYWATDPPLVPWKLGKDFRLKAFAIRLGKHAMLKNHAFITIAHADR